MDDNQENTRPSSVASNLIAAYNATQYRVITDSPFNLKIGERSRQLAELYQKYNCASSAIITAWNPQSVAASKGYNLAAQLKLETELSARSVPFITAFGEDPKMEWPGEESFLVLNLNLDTAKELGIEFQQNAVVWSGQDAIPQLVLLR